MSSNHGRGSNHFDGSDRQIVRAVAESCGWELEQISDERDVFVVDDPLGGIDLPVDYRHERLELRGELVGLDIYRRQVKPGGCVEGLQDILDALRHPLQEAWHRRLEDNYAREQARAERDLDADGQPLDLGHPRWGR